MKLNILTIIELCFKGKTGISGGEPSVYRRPSNISQSFYPPGLTVTRRATIAVGEGHPHVPHNGLGQDNSGYDTATADNTTYFN